MKHRFLTALAVPLALSACTLPNLAALYPAAPAPLAQTTIDDTALEVAWRSFDAALDGINLLIDAKVIKIGSPKAVAIANGIDKVTATLKAAEHAASAGSATSYKTALDESKAAILDLRIALRSN